MAGLDGLQPEFAKRLNALMGACNGITVTSGLRSTADQARLYAASDKTGRTVAPPGRSNHEKGEAADIGGNLTCAHAKASQFGLRFPMSYEPWHIERSDLVAGSNPLDFLSNNPVAQAGAAVGGVASDGIGGLVSVLTAPAKLFMHFAAWIGQKGKYALLFLGGFAVALAGLVLLSKDLITGAAGDIIKSVVA